MSLEKLIILEEMLETEGYDELLKACRAIVGSDGTETGVANSINEDVAKEIMGTSKVYWLKYKIIILENITIFEEKCRELSLNPDKFIKEINEEVKKVEAIL